MPSVLHRALLAAAALAVIAAGCAPTDAGETTAPTSDAPATVSGDADELTVVVHRDESCSCCGRYEEFLADRGFEVVQEVHTDLSAVKAELGVPSSERSCHTAEIGGYVVEGHMPMLAIRRLLDQQPDVDGIALAGMPTGSPGMGGEQSEPFVVTSLVDGEVAGEFGSF